MEFMDAGSLDKFAGCTVPEPVLKRVTGAMVRGLKFLKDELQIMHRGAFSFPHLNLPSLRILPSVLIMLQYYREIRRCQANERPHQHSWCHQTL